MKTDSPPNRYQCSCCRRSKADREFYASKSFLFKDRLPFCKDCVTEYFNQLLERCSFDVERAIYFLCMRLDIPFSKSMLEGAKKTTEKTGKLIHQVYIKNINSLADVNNQGRVFMDGEHLPEYDVAINVSSTPTTLTLDKEDTIELEYLKMKWGAALPVEDLIYLEQKYQEWYDNYDIQGKSMELLVQQLCFEELYVYQDRQKGKDVSKRLKTIQEMMKNSKLAPRQETAAEQAEFQTISEFIKNVEQSRPLVKKNPEFDDPDNFRVMWQAMAGAIARTMGRPDENTKVFEERFKDYTLDLSVISKDSRSSND